MRYLEKITTILKEKINMWDNSNDFRIPMLWDTFCYNGEEKRINSDGTISVNPYRFYYECITKTILPLAENNLDYLQSLSQIKRTKRNRKTKIYSEGGNWIKTSSVYAMQIRTSSAWDHDSDGVLALENEFLLKDTGTFVKTIALLPLIKKMGFDAIYTLPITKNSTKYKKGEMGSPYAVKNFFELDPVLKEPMTAEATIEEEFSAFIEACHILGIRFIIDIIPRTSARDSDLILNHPDWFYWIRVSDLKRYAPPKVDGMKPLTKANEKNLSYIYSDKNVKEYLSLFTFSPDIYSPQKWESIKKECEMNKNLDFFELIETKIGLTTAPAFSDCINDPQPPWTDVTYLRLYLDHPVLSASYVSANQPPYILFDVIRSNVFKGNIKNDELWAMISDIIPYYQKNFGIDGARIDMGHALPKELEDMIISKARKMDEDFCFIAEELGIDAHKKAKESGYNMIIGNVWAKEPRYYEGAIKRMIDDLVDLEVPVFAASEMPDTPRAASRLGGNKFSVFSIVLNNFLPNGVPFLTSGQEMFEVQPMNLGLDPQPDGAFKLSKADPLYGKLAFFDKYALHWTNKEADKMIDLIKKVADIRKRYIDYINPNNFVKIFYNSKFVLSFGYELGKGKYLMVVANCDLLKSKKTEMNLKKTNVKIENKMEVVKTIFSLNGEDDVKLENNKLIALLKPLDIKIFVF